MDKIVSRSQMQTILDSRPKGVAMDDIVKAYTSNGYKVEGINYEKPVEEPSLASKLGNRVKDFGNAVTTGVTLGANTLDPNTPQVDKGLATIGGLAQAGMAPMKAVGAIGGTVGDVIGAGIKATGLDKPLGEFVAPIAQSDVAQGAVKAFQSLPPEYQDYLKTGLDASNVIGLGLGKKAITTGAEVAGNVAKPVIGAIEKGISKITPTSESIMQRVARVPKGEQIKFEKLAGESIGSYLDKTGNYGTPDKIIEKLYNDFTQSKQNADDALASIKGTYKSEPVSTALSELEGKVKRTSSPGAPDSDLARVTELVNKEKTDGLTMSEVNEVKRIYERRVRLDYLKSNVAEDVTRANNVDNALRSWQDVEAKKAGLTNLPEINKSTQLNKQLMDALGKEQAGIGGNNALGLTDAILLAGGSPESIASLLTKKAFSDPGIQSFFAKNLSKNKIKKGVPEANFSKQELPQSQEIMQIPSTKSTPVLPEGKGIRGMYNPAELLPKQSININNIVKKMSEEEASMISEYLRASRANKPTPKGFASVIKGMGVKFRDKEDTLTVLNKILEEWNVKARTKK